MSPRRPLSGLAALLILLAPGSVQAGGAGPRPAAATQLPGQEAVGLGTLGLGTLGLGSACRAGFVRPDLARLAAELKEARERWEKSGARRSGYTYALTRVAAPVLLPKVTVTVWPDGRVTTRPEQVAGGHPGTVESLFAEVARGLTYARTQPCVSLKVRYSAAWGLPTDYTVADERKGLADANSSWTLRNFWPMGGKTATPRP